MRFHLAASIGAGVLLLAFRLGAQGPDVIVGDLPSAVSWGSSGPIVAYSVGTTSCNLGDAVLSWEADTPDHPVIGQQMYRLRDGRFDQIGVSWLKHGFCALSQTLCGPCLPTDCSTLGIGCSDPYTAERNGQQPTLGPRSQVNPHTGVFPFPFSAPGYDPVIGRRLQVPIDDVDPQLNVGALYWVEGHYVTQDDAAAGNQDNNVSYRSVTVGSDVALFPIDVNGSTVQQLPAIYAWQAEVPTVEIDAVRVPSEGLLLLAHDVRDNGDGTWHYEYALYNMNSDISARSFDVPFTPGGTLTNVQFFHTPYHSGEPYSTAPWSSSVGASSVTWSTNTFAVDPNANALRWSRMFTFRFDSDSPPVAGTGTVGMFKNTATVNVPIL
ncbi:MAG: hypothetical protein KDC38_00930, partial [Planctomycetes bacterium]|nr:hypothetical protein [Planctomycetota bacterium]